MASPPKRAFGFWICLALVVGNMIGSGVFALPALLAPFGWNAALGWLVTIAGSLCLAFVFARLARSFPAAGGPYAYCREAFGHAPSFAVAWSYWIAILSANSAIALTTVSYLSHFFPGFAAAPGVVAMMLVWTLTAIACLTLRGAGDLQVVTTLLKLLPLAAALLLIGLIGIGHEAAPPADPPVKGFDSLAAAFEDADCLPAEDRTHEAAPGVPPKDKPAPPPAPAPIAPTAPPSAEPKPSAKPVDARPLAESLADAEAVAVNPSGGVQSPTAWRTSALVWRPSCSRNSRTSTVFLLRPRWRSCSTRMLATA
jgi:hypothetical protein